MPINRLLYPLYFVVLLACAFDVSMTYYNVTVITRTNAWVYHTRDVIESLQDFRLVLNYAESGHRGFLLTGDEAFLRAYDESAAGVAKSYARTLELTRDNRVQQETLARIGPLVADKFAFMSNTVALERSGRHADAVAVVSSGQGRRLMDQIQVLSEKMQGEEDRLLMARIDACRDAVWRTVALFVASSFLIVLLVFVVWALYRRGEDNRLVSGALVERLAAIVESSFDAIIGKTLDGTVTSWNRGAERIFGYTAEEMIGRPITTLIPPDCLPMETEVLAKLRRGEVVEMFESTRLHKDGRLLDIALTISPVRDARGDIVGAAQIAHDVSLQRRSDAELRMSEARQTALFASTIDAIITIDERGDVVQVNASAEATFGYTAAEMVGREMAALIIPEASREGHRHGMARFLSTGESRVLNRRLELTAMRSDGSTFPIELTVVPVSSGRGFTFTGFLRDISDRKRRERELSDRAEELRRSNKDLELFAYIASHDLQEPLRMVSGFSQLLSRRYKGQLDERADEFISYIVGGVARMQDLISDLLTYSRANTEGETRAVEVECESVLDEVLLGLKVEIGRTGAVVTRDPLPAVAGDRPQIFQVFQNVIANAIKFTEPGVVPEVHVGVEPDGEMWRFAVSDKGIGIDPKFADRIFLLFQRLNHSELYKGNGMGLAICKKVVERHGGRIWVDSAPAQGSCFRFTLPKWSPPA